MHLAEYRASSLERQRTADLLRLMPMAGRNALDIGARDGHFSLLMADRFETVVALDLTEPNISHLRVQCIQGNATEMQFSDNSFDFVQRFWSTCRRRFCIKSVKRLKGCQSSNTDWRSLQTRHQSGANDLLLLWGENPPWGHVNSFDEERITELFRSCAVEAISFCGVTTSQTNSLSTALMDFAGNPYGTYDQEEACIHCGHRLLLPPRRNVAQRIATKLAFFSHKVTELFEKSRGNWMHVVLHKVNDV